MVTMRDGVRISLCVYRPDARGRVPGAVRGLALPVRDGRRCRPIRCFCGARPARSNGTSSRATPMCTPTCAAPATPRASSSFMGAERAAGLCRADRLDHQAGLEQRPRRRHRPVVLRDGAVADGDLRTRRASPASCPTTGWSTSTAARTITAASTAATARSGTRRCAPTTAPPGRPARPAADEVRSGRRDHRALARRRVLARALAVLAARQDQVPGAVDRPLGQDGPAPARQHPRLRGASRRRRSSSSPARATPSKRTTMFDQVEFHEKELLPFYDLHLKGKNNGFMERAPVKIFVRGANVWRAEEEWPPKRAVMTAVLSAQGAVRQRHLAQRRRALGRARPRRTKAPTSYTYPDWEWVNGVAVIGPDGRVDSGAARADLHQRAARRPISKSPGRSC